MTPATARGAAAWLGMLLLLAAGTSCAQDNDADTIDIGDTSDTWYAALGHRQHEVQPSHVDLLSIQVSKLPRDTFGHGKPPFGHGFVSSFLAASGTGIYGVLDLDVKGDLQFQEDLSSLAKFVDDTGEDLTTNPGEAKINTFFGENKLIDAELSKDQARCLFTVRGYTTPTSGAKTLTADARLVFLALSKQQTRTEPIKRFEPSEEIHVGPLSITVYKAGNTPPFRSGRSVNPAFDKEPREWALRVAPRQKPVKQAELLDAEGNVLRTIICMHFAGKSYRYYLEKLESPPQSIRVTWYEDWELAIVPLAIETPLGI